MNKEIKEQIEKILENRINGTMSLRNALVEDSNNGLNDVNELIKVQDSILDTLKEILKQIQNLNSNI